MNDLIKIENKLIGSGQPCLIIAEIGSNHNQDWALALKTIDAAIEAGVDAIKFQTFKATEHVSTKAKTPAYLKSGENLHEIIRKLELNRDWQEPLMRYCQEREVIFFSSPCDYEAVDQLEEIGVGAHKVASFDLPDTDLVRYIASTGKPIILSTGLADWMDIQRAIDVCHDENNDQIVLLQCTSLYPAPLNLSNLRAMETMRMTFNVLTGYSDHTMGDTVSCAAVARGACIIEKHLTFDRKLPGPDHPFAMEPSEMKVLVNRIRDTEMAIGDGVKNGPRPEEAEIAEMARRSLHAKCNISSGETITGAMLKTKRPGHGVQPFLKDQLIGRTAKCDIEADSWITWEMV